MAGGLSVDGPAPLACFVKDVLSESAAEKVGIAPCSLAVAVHTLQWAPHGACILSHK